ncbi:hypothetical protein CYLTODRAFT_425607 [Cylindrobasidium torrendii FP15055 ss-10]|uniref:LYC1 C-terminal domain-containing protein n=1 Tax=Cylindrobasidium torrendii FP15055 ss-10 TaxID=1314674 RepID=A0A0D7B0J8_9AGAR|nr:hypothetical protein CYLTODRAFT_425607 [Cylindrobasidium torrendii FP15055 ss-10]
MTDTFPYLSMFIATPEQERLYSRGAAEQWGVPNGLTVDEFVAADEVRSQAAHANNGKSLSWVLAPRDDPTTLDFRCACSTYRRTALIKRPNDAEPQEVHSYIIVGVLTPPQNRGKGYASLMMRLVHDLVGANVLPEGLSRPTDFHPAQFSILYSGVGPKFYATSRPYSQGFSKDLDYGVGWIPRDSTSSVYIIPEGVHVEKDLPDGWRWLQHDEMAALWENEKQFIAEGMQNTSQSSQVLFSVLPSGGVEEFQRAWAHYLYDKLDPPMNIAGAVRNDARAVVSWALNGEKEPRGLILTRLRADSEQDGEDVLRAAIALTAQHGLREVEMWNMPLHLRGAAAKLGFAQKERVDILPSFKWYGPERPEDVVWMNNERYCWM